MRPLLVLATDSQNPSGLGEHMLALGRCLRNEFDVVLACQDDAAGMGFLQRAAAVGLRVKAIDLENLAGFQRWLSDSGVSLLHVHAGIGWEGHALARAGKAASLPVIRTEHLPYLLTSVVQQAEYRAMLQSIDRVIVVSQAVFDSHVGHPGAGGLRLVRNGIDAAPPLQSRAAVRAELGFLAQDQIVLTVARFNPQKGYDVLLDAIPQVLMTYPEAKFVLVGDGPDWELIRSKASQPAFERSVVVLGQRSDVADLLAAADLFVLPSHFEGLPLALLEAMAAGLPVVATAIGGTTEAIGGDHPYLVPPAEPATLATTIIEALGDPDGARAAAAKAQARFSSHFGASRMARETAEIYTSFLVPEPRRGISA